jgi:hypothetical protein
MFRSLLVVIAAIALSSCATARYVTPDKLMDVPGISGAQVYIYSFLDLREADLGERMVAEVNERLRADLAERGIQTELVTYRQTQTDREPSRGLTVMIPVDRIVASQLSQEQALGADFRLMIIPSDMRIYGSNQSYEINWDLVDISTGEVVWTTRLQGGRTIWWSTGEDPEGRARAFVYGVIRQMELSGLFRPYAAEEI